MFFQKDKKKASIPWQTKKEVYLIAYFLTGNKEKAYFLTEKVLLKKKFTYQQKQFEDYVKNLYKLWRKFEEHDKKTGKDDNHFLLLNLPKLSEEEQMIILLRYGKNFPIDKIAKILHMSVRKVRTCLITTLSIWRDSKRFSSLETYREAFQKCWGQVEVDELKLSSIEDGSNHKTSKGNRKKWIAVPFFISFIFITGGTVDAALIKKTKVSAGPDIIKLFKEGTIESEINKKLEKQGFYNFYLSVYHEEKVIYMYLDKKRNTNENKKMLAIVNTVLKERKAEYNVVLDYFDTVETEDTDSKITEKEENEHQMMEEASDLRVRQVSIFSVDMEEEKWTLWVPNDFSGKEKVDLLEKMEQIQKKYKDKRKISFHYYNEKKIESEARWSQLLPYITEALELNENYHFRNVELRYKHGVMEVAIYTDLLKENKKSKETAQEMERGVRKFIESKELADITKQDKYQLKITGAGGDKLR
ncbi:sigma factor-like helix-turn-helix DNA-binding protein [Niallia nealsonii]|uniref:RNA polymerase sigma factor 70 region 4 type 2 domain-containing protein n=1 Tax=Niallia nealsonii TaxID=115979 RepID=A0A2N0Z333_9BACI|nr:sigma-70 region 4 domain-containing protein [Niallia nealsonii]PKG23907.1 hypothetical protein CWS01_09040 [Niallia nealsonii]